MPSEMMTAWLESDDDVLEAYDGRPEPWWSSGESSYHAGVRSALAPAYQGMSSEEIDDLVDRVMESATAEDAEDFGSFLSDLGRAVAPIAAQVLPVAAPIIGTAIGGPAGAMVGQAVGQYAGQALAGGTQQQRPAAPAAPRPATPMTYAPPPAAYTAPKPAPPPAALPAPRPVAQPVQPVVAQPVASAPTTPAPAPATPSVLAQLIALLDSPALRQLLAGQVLGNAGVQAVPVGPESIPVTFPTMMEALSVLAGSAAESAPRYGESTESESTAYMRDASGQLVYDPAVPEERVAALVAQLRAGESVGAAGEAMSEAHDDSVGDWLSRAGLVQ